MIQLLGLREFVTKDTGELKVYDAFFKNGWRAPSIFELFANLESFVEQVPADERFNMFYTVATCTENKREFLFQEVIPLDIDGIEAGTEGKVVTTVCTELGLDESKVGVVYSGNGVHILIGLRHPIKDVAELRAQKVHYKALCGRVSLALYEAGLHGKVDPTVFSESRILRLPFTKNIKPGKPEKLCSVINRNIVPLDVDVFSLAGVPSTAPGEHIHPNAFARFPDPDSEAVQSKCGFIASCRTSPETVSEPMWYAMLSIVGRLNDGKKLAHEYSKGHSGYSEKVTEYKLQHALESAGPRTCENISQMWEGCKTCPHFNKITSPIQLVSDDTIRSQANGFYNIVIKDGVPKQGKPNYDDLVKWYSRTHDYITIGYTQSLYTYKQDHWQEVQQAYIHAFAEDNFRPTPTSAMCNEFEHKLKRSNLRDASFFLNPGLINFKNGVLDMKTGKLMPHSKEYGFTYVIPYDFAPTGKAPVFNKFIDDVTCGKKDIAKMLLEYMGYCISGEDPEKVQQCAILHGDGSNGKSVLMNLLRELLGRENCSAVSIEGLKKETNRYSMVNKMLNISAETPKAAFLDSDIFKGLVAGDVVPVRRLYEDVLPWKCTTRMIFACNELPAMNDSSYGMLRRLVLIPFDATFSSEKGNLDPDILNKLLNERSDIIVTLLSHWGDVVKNSYRIELPESVIESIKEYRDMSDSVTRYCNQAMRHDADAVVTTDMAYRCYTAWADEMRATPLAYPAFTKRFAKIATNMGAEKHRLPDGGQRGFKGVKLDMVIL